MSEQPAYGVLGVGSIATAMVSGLCDGVDDPPRVVLSPRNADRAAELAARFASVEVAEDNQAVVDGCDVVLVCLRPDAAGTVLADLRFRAGQAVVSAVAGLDMARLGSLVAPADDPARSIPLPAVATRESVTPVHPATSAATALFDRLGGVLDVPDEQAFEAIAAASATVTAYFGYLGAVSGWLADHGVEEVDARRYVADTFAALAGELRAPGADFDGLASAHATPGGLNEQFARDLDEAGVYDAVRAGLERLLAPPG